MNRTTIEWTDYTWNPVTGCHKVSPGCKNCYAETLTNRFAKTWGVESFREVVLHEDRLSEPEKNRKKWAGKKVFVCSMSDLFQEEVPFSFIAKVMVYAVSSSDTIFQILTKRPDRAVAWFKHHNEVIQKTLERPHSNIWIGTSCENQETANERIPHLLQIPAAVRFLSCEPLLGPIDIFKAVGSLNEYGGVHKLAAIPKDFSWEDEGIQWVIAGGESGHNARPMHPAWMRSLRDQCESAQVPFFFKQWGEWLPMDHLAEDQYWQSKKSMEVGTGYTSNTVFKVGKSKAGNLLDGKQHLEFPAI